MEVTFQFAWELKLIEALQQMIAALPFLKQFFSFLTIFGEPVAAVVVIGFMYWCIDKKNGIRTAICTLMAMISNVMIKNIFRRIRPYSVNKSIECLKVPESKYDIYDMAKQGYSFPSGHATVSSAISTSLYRIKKSKKLLIGGSIMVLLISISRVALGVHYPTDVLAGICFGIVSVIITDRLMEILDKKKLYLLLLVYSCLGIFYCKSNDYYSILGLMIGFTCGDLFDEKYVSFENTKNYLRMVIRTLVGGIIFVMITTLLKMPFTTEVLEAHNLFAYFYRVFRYAISAFLIIGLYPILFRYNILKFKE